jgi:hypothetical protein
VDLQDRLPAEKLTRSVIPGRVEDANPESQQNLPVAVESIAAIVIAAAVIAAIVNPEHALDGAHRPADAGSDRATDHTTYGARDPVAFPGAFLRAANDPLSMPDMRNRE